MARWEQLIAARKQLSLSQTEAAERLQVGLLTYQKWELGKAEPQPQNRRRLRELFPLLDRPLPEKQESVTEMEVSVQSPIPTAVDLSQAQESTQTPTVFSTALEVSVPSLSLKVSADPGETEETVACSIEPNMIDALLTSAFVDHLTIEDKRNAVKRIIKECDSMNTTNKNYQITRRAALVALAKLPMITLGLTISGNVVLPKRYGEALEHCAVALEGCWELFWSNEIRDVLLAFQCASTYLPILKTIARDSTGYRKEALDLATRYALFKTMLGWDCVSMAETISYAREALALSKETGEISLQLSAYLKLAWAYVDDKKYALAFQMMQEGEALLKRYQKAQKPELPSGVIGSFYSAMAIAQTKNGECPDQALGFAIDSAPGIDPNSFIVFAPSTQLKEAASICCSKGDQTQAMKYFAKRINVETLAPRIAQSEWGRVETINILTLSMLKSKERDMGKIIHHWSAAIEGAKALKYEYAFNQAVANLEGMEMIWPGEKRITELRDLIVHW